MYVTMDRGMNNVRRMFQEYILGDLVLLVACLSAVADLSNCDHRAIHRPAVTFFWTPIYPFPIPFL